MTQAIWLDWKNSEVRQAVRVWWRSLEDDRGGRAELRRCATAAEVALCPAFHRLLKALAETRPCDPLPPEQVRRLAPAAALLAVVRQDAEAGEPSYLSLATLFAAPRKGGASAILSGLRFRRLLQAEDPARLWPLLLRAIHLLGDRAPVLGLAHDVTQWGEAVRQRWAQDYYAAAPDRNDPKAA